MDLFTGSLENSKTSPSPGIEPFIPDSAGDKKIGLIVCPGGGYEFLAEHEGRGYAEFFRNQGIACFVVQYRLGSGGHRHPAMLEDALAAIETIRKRAGEWGVDPNRIGVMGSSAGGHLAAHAMTAYGNHTSSVSLRPDFGVLCYPVISMRNPFTHTGSRTNLLGENATDTQIDEVSCELLVGPGTPPCFLWHTVEDGAVPVENSLLYASALRTHRIPFEMHLYEKGGHGMGLGAPYPWGQECIRWMNGL
jgi:acetyl esterase/lipase